MGVYWYRRGICSKEWNGVGNRNSKFADVADAAGWGELGVLFFLLVRASGTPHELAILWSRED